MNLLFLLITSLTATLALLSPQAISKHGLLIRRGSDPKFNPPEVGDLSHIFDEDGNFKDGGSMFDEVGGHFDGTSGIEERFDEFTKLPEPTYPYQIQDLSNFVFREDDGYIANMGSSYVPFDRIAQYDLPQDMEYEPYGGPETDTFFNLDDAQVPQVHSGSYEDIIAQQEIARAAKTAVSGSDVARITVKLTNGKGVVTKYDLPPKVQTDPNRPFDKRLGQPIKFPNGKEGYINKEGTITNNIGEMVDDNGNGGSARKLLTARNGKQLRKGKNGKLADQSRLLYTPDGIKITKKKKPNPQQMQDHKNRKREDIIGTIQKTEVSSTTNTTTSQIQRKQFRKYLNTYYAVQANISALVLPLIQEITNSTNSTLIHDVAISAYVEIVGYPISISSPFVAGMNCIDWLEKQYFNGTNNSVAAITAKPKTSYTDDDIHALQYFTSYKTLLNVYNHAYYNGSKAANSTGLLDTLYTLKRYLMTNDTSIMPEDFTSVNTKYLKQLFPHHSNDTSAV